MSVAATMAGNYRGPVEGVANDCLVGCGRIPRRSALGTQAAVAGPLGPRKSPLAAYIGRLAAPRVWLSRCSVIVARYIMIRTLYLVFGCAIMALGAPACGSKAQPSDREIVSGLVLFRNVTVVPMDSEQVLRDRSVLVRGQTIESIFEVGEDDAAPLDAAVVDGNGGYLMPGLADMHVHLNRADLAAYVDYGITTVRHLWGYPEVQSMAAETAAGTTVGPSVYALSPGLDGTPASWPFTQFVNQPQEAAAVVDQQIADGWLGLKLYQNLTLDAFDAIVAHAIQNNVPFGGHVPSRTDVYHALESGYRHIEHFSGYERVLSGANTHGWPAWISIDESQIPELVQRTVEAGTWNCPTFAIFKKLSENHPDAAAVTANRRLFLKALHDGGARVLAGTDTGIDVVFPGVSLLVELEEFTAAGLSPYDALLASTRHAAEFLGELEVFGTVEVGKRADLILLRENPLESIDALSTLRGTMIRGKWIPK